MMPTGLLPDMSASLGVSESQIGLLVSVFAFTVVLSSTPLAALTRRAPRHTLLVLVLIVFAVSNVATALAPNYPVIVAARVLGGASHGLFWAIVGAYAGHLVPREQLGRAVAIALGGGTLAYVLGVPIGTALGHAVGWRVSFLIVAAFTFAGAALVWRFLPPVQSSHEAAVGAPPRARGLDATAGAVALLCVTTAIVMVGHYAFYTYIAPFATERMGVDAGAVGGVLFAYGVAGAVGLVLSGTAVAARRPTLSLFVCLVVVALAVTLMTVFSGIAWIAFPSYLLWGVAFGILPALLQTRLLSTASPRIRDTASAVYTTAFNAGIGAGALVGSLAYDAVGLDGTAVLYIGALLVAIAIVAGGYRRRSRSGSFTGR
ncbi:MFS transporter [Microbacteriaceae bacterium VKM Ac-2855]|nr:MFS transporter [Microbacteriaceae bacterium VKM Ac-2855]